MQGRDYNSIPDDVKFLNITSFLDLQSIGFYAQVSKTHEEKLKKLSLSSQFGREILRENFMVDIDMIKNFEDYKCENLLDFGKYLAHLLSKIPERYEKLDENARKEELEQAFLDSIHSGAFCGGK